MIDLEKVSIVEWFNKKDECVETYVKFLEENGVSITQDFSKDHPYTLFTALRYLQKRLDLDEKNNAYVTKSE